MTAVAGVVVVGAPSPVNHFSPGGPTGPLTPSGPWGPGGPVVAIDTQLPVTRLAGFQNSH